MSRAKDRPVKGARKLVIDDEEYFWLARCNLSSVTIWKTEDGEFQKLHHETGAAVLTALGEPTTSEQLVDCAQIGYLPALRPSDIKSFILLKKSEGVTA